MIRVLESALKHGLDQSEILAAFHAPLYTAQLQEHPPKIMLVGVGKIHPVEIGYTINHDGTTVIFHAMPATKAILNQARRTRKRYR